MMYPFGITSCLQLGPIPQLSLGWGDALWVEVPGWVWLFISPKGKAGEGVQPALRLHHGALISRIKIPRQLLPKWLRAVQGGWETPGAVTGRHAGRQRARSVTPGLLREEKTNTQTQPPPRRRAAPRCLATPMPRVSPQRASVRWPASLPASQHRPRGMSRLIGYPS